MFISGDKKKLIPFDYNRQAFGGTEYMARNFHKNILPYMPKLYNYNSVIAPGNVPPIPELIASDKKTIFWMHNTPQQYGEYEMSVLKSKEFVDVIKYFIVPSEVAKQLVLEVVDIDPNKVKVIYNAIEPLKYNPSKFNDIKQVRLIHTSSADRGLDVLLNAVNMINEDFRLEVYNNFNPDLEQGLPEFDKRIKFFAKTPKATVMEAYENSHIHAYPSTYPETFCLSQVEAMSAGLLCVTSDLGSLPEVSGGYTRMYSYSEDRMEHAKIFAEHLTKAIQDIKQGNWNSGEQIKYANSEYSWERHKERWLELHDKL